MTSQQQPAPSFRIFLHKNDLPEGLKMGQALAIDTEAMGLNHHRDRLCLVQITDGSGDIHLIQLEPKLAPERSPNLVALLADSARLKIFHYARFDVGILQYSFGIRLTNIFCTKIAARLAMTYARNHGLKDLCYDLLKEKISKQQQTSDWGRAEISEEQKEYAASDVKYLHQLMAVLQGMLQREGREELAQAIFQFIPYLAELGTLGWGDEILNY